MFHQLRGDGRGDVGANQGQDLSRSALIVSPVFGLMLKAFIKGALAIQKKLSTDKIVKMGKVTTAALVLVLVIAGPTIRGQVTSPHQRSFDSFWTKFKTAVIKRNKKSVASLSRFPFGIGEGLSNISNAADLDRRFDEVFHNETDAAQCFATRSPTPDTEIPDRYTVVCPNKEDNFVVYEFDYIDHGWKFIHRQFPTKCRCR